MVDSTGPLFPLDSFKKMGNDKLIKLNKTIETQLQDERIQVKHRKILENTAAVIRSAMMEKSIVPAKDIVTLTSGVVLHEKDFNRLVDLILIEEDLDEAKALLTSIGFDKIQIEQIILEMQSEDRK